MPTLIGIVYCLKIVWFEFVNIKGAKVNLHEKSPTFNAAKLKGFTVCTSKFDIGNSCSCISICLTVFIEIFCGVFMYDLSMCVW